MPDTNDPSYNTLIVFEQGGTVLRVKSGGSLIIDSGGTFTGGGTVLEVTSGQQLKIDSGATIGIVSGGALKPDGGSQAADPGAITDSTSGAASATFAAITAGATYAQADIVAIKNALAETAAKLNALRAALQGVGILA